MARIPDEVLAQVKRIDLKTLVEASGVALTRRGKEWVGLCPLHPDEKTPSLCVNPEKGSWHCFGCDKGGSVIDFAMAIEGLGFRQAVERLIATHLPGVELEASLPPAGPCPISPDVDVDERLGQVSAFYEETLHGDDSRGRDYLESRGIWDEDLARRFRIGFANRTLGPLLPLKATVEGARIREALQEIGILRESGHEHLNGRVTVLLSDLEERPVQMYGRSVTPNLRAGTPKHMYLPGPRSSCVFNLSAVREHRELILCEAIFDALTFLRHGFANVTTAFGKNGLTPALFDAMKRFGTKRVLIAYDRDQPGDKSAVELGERLLAAGIEPYRVCFPRGMDANEYARKLTPAGKSLELALRKASYMGAGEPPSIALPRSEESKPAAKERAAPPSAASSLSPPEPPAPPATSLPVVPRVDVPAVVKEHEVVITLGDRRYRVRGLDRNLSYGSLKVNVLAARGEGFHVDTLDLYSSRQRGVFLKQVALELGVEEEVAKRDLAKVFLKLEELQEEQIERALEPQLRAVELSAEEEEAALSLLRDPRLVERVLEDLERCGLVGERTNKLVGYLAAVSRKLTRPLAVLVQSSSAAGKSALMEGVLALVPGEERVQYSAMTGQSLFYMGEKDLAHKVLAIAEEEGAERASYALKLLQSEGELSIASTGKDPATGRLVTHEYHVEGPVAILLTTTAIDLDEELLNRCVVLTVDEGREQTRAIHRMQRQRETLEGQLELLGRERLRTLHQNAQRLLRPLMVVNPYASQLRFPDSCTRTRRDHEKYLMLIRAIALLHQHQRRIEEREEAGRRVPYVEVTLGDLELANRLAHEVLGRTLDELPPQTRRLLLRIEELVAAECEKLAIERQGFHFTRRWLREETGLGDTQLKVHLARLVDMEYLIAHREGHAQRHLYELLYDGGGKNGRPYLPGLIDLEGLQCDGNRSGQNGNRSAPGRPSVGGWSGGGRSEVSAAKRETLLKEGEASSGNGTSGKENGAASYVVLPRPQGAPGSARPLEKS